MRQGQHKSRQRSRGPRRQGGSSQNRVYESNGPDVKVRGTAQTVADKYLQLARDAVSSGDNVSAESYYQHAEHYLRIIAANQSQQQQSQQQHNSQQHKDQGGEGRQSATPDKPSQNGADEVPGSGPQPGLEKSVKKEKSAKEEKSPSTDNGGFDGQAPDFLAKPVTAEKPKRSRRPSAKSSSVKSEPEGRDDAEPAEAQSEGASATSPDAEVAAG